MTDLNRRSFLTRGALLAGATVMGPAAFSALTARSAGAAVGDAAGYGPLARARAVNEPAGPEYLALPAGFSYVVFGKIGSLMKDGNPTPVNLDGMAAFESPRGGVRLIRNHEDRNAPGMGSVLGPQGTKYDPLAGGGTTTLDFDPSSRTLERDFISLNGTIVNCAGGIATINDRIGWMTSEETTAGPEQGWGAKHGYNFFVPLRTVRPRLAEPFNAMGRFAHEATFRDDASGIFYQTEDGGSGRGSGFYRFLPTRDDAREGRLQMMAVRGRPQADLREGQTEDVRIPVEWVDIPTPDPADPIIQAPLPGATSVFAQGFAAGGAKFNRLEGIWNGGDSVIFASTSGGDAKNGDVNSDGFAEGFGQIWKYVPGKGEGGRLILLFESPGGDVLDSPDNLVVTPRGGILLCEDDASSKDGLTDIDPLAPEIENVNRLIGLTMSGNAFKFAVNTFNDSEFAGTCFSPDGRTLFVNIFGDRTPGSGMTCAIRGPWRNGAL
jgi:secreted PhoX family phosphatase